MLMNERSIVQDRLSAVQSGNIGALEEFPNGDFIAPEQGFLHRGRPVRRVKTGVVLELLQPWTEPLVGIVVIVGDAGAEDVQERESLVLDPVLDQLGEMLL